MALRKDRGPYDEMRVHRDAPNPPVIATVRALRAAGSEVIFCSGRTDGCRRATEAWLAGHVLPDHAGLYMRKAGDVRKDAVVKEEIYRLHIEPFYDVLLVLDDRNRVVAMWRALGLTVLQVADGDF